MRTEKSDRPAELISDEQMGGDVRLRGHRIRAYDIWMHAHEFGHSVEEIAEEIYPHLRREQVEVALEYARGNPQEMREIELLNEAAWREHQAEDLRKAAKWLGETCPHCGEGVLVVMDAGPASFLACSECDRVTIVGSDGDLAPIGDNE